MQPHQAYCGWGDDTGDWLIVIGYWLFEMNLTGKSALVTGASRGIGRAVALDLAARGASVLVNYNSSEAAAQDVVKAIEAAGGAAIACKADVSKTDEAANLIKAAIDAFGKLDILVNNAGTTRDMLLMQMKEEDWDHVIAADLKSVFNCTKAATKPMMRARFGRIVVGRFGRSSSSVRSGLGSNFGLSVTPRLACNLGFNSFSKGSFRFGRSEILRGASSLENVNSVEGFSEKSRFGGRESSRFTL